MAVGHLGANNVRGIRTGRGNDCKGRKCQAGKAVDEVLFHFIESLVREFLNQI